MLARPAILPLGSGYSYEVNDGIVAKPLESPYRPGERGWIKVKNRAYWRSGRRSN